MLVQPFQGLTVNDKKYGGRHTTRKVLWFRKNANGHVDVSVIQLGVFLHGYI